jgi:hypothetical protein
VKISAKKKILKIRYVTAFKGTFLSNLKCLEIDVKSLLSTEKSKL